MAFSTGPAIGTLSMANFESRSYELEHLDKGDYTPEEYEGCIVELQRVNRWLGDSRALRRSLLESVAAQEVKEFSVLDVGAGSGELLRFIATWSEKKKKTATLIGLEFNERSAGAIVAESQEWPNIRSVRGDALNLPFANDSFDYVMCSLFTHHFRENDIVRILREMQRVARKEIVVIDLHRHPIAYAFYTTLGKLFLYNRLIREDGALSILRGFKPDELRVLGEEAGLYDVSVERRFPYRIVMKGRAGRGKRGSGEG
jgi:ubiquinone/menaquinone biosynthesis C-methylase UbiE